MSTWIRRLVVLAAGALGAIGVAGAGVYGITSVQLSRDYDVPVAPLTIAYDSASVERGRHVAIAIAKCVDCHGADFGGKVIVEDPGLGRIVAPNLTSGVGGIANYTDVDLVRAIRYGVRPDGKPLVFMPSYEYVYLTDADLAAVVAYLRSLPPVDRTWPGSQIGLMARLLYVAGRLDALVPAAMIDREEMRPDSVVPGPTAEYGAYLSMVGGCSGCHGPGLSGGRIPGTPPDFPPATNITPAGIGSWSEEDFFVALREGRRPDGSTIDPRMPWAYTAQMTDDEIRALWLYLRMVPPRKTGTR